MVLGAIVFLGVGLLFLVLACLLYRGKTDLIHSYHQTRVKDKKAYGRAYAKAMGVMAVSLIASGILSLFIREDEPPTVMLAVLFGGLFVGLVMIFWIQKKYNQGLF